MIGAAIGGKVVQFGRRKTHFVCCAIGTLGALITLYPSWHALLIGRTIFGLAAGL